MSSFQRLHKFSWQQTMIRIKDPRVSVPFYQENFGLKLIHRYDFPEWEFSLYFLGIFPEGTTLPEPCTPESENFLWTMDGLCLELTHNHGTENDDNYKTNNGNVEPHRGFGHLAFMTPDVYAACDKLESNGVKFQKKPDEGRMKGLAFALDPDGYWLEIIRRSSASPVKLEYTLAQTMIRVKDPQKSLTFYRDILGMDLVAIKEFGVGTDWGFSLYFLAHLTEDQRNNQPDPRSEEAAELQRIMFQPVLELTHNHGTETRPDFKYHNGNDEDEGQARGFGHTGFLVADLRAACSWLDTQGVAFMKRPEEGEMNNLAFVYDPDGYWVEIIQKGFSV